MSKRSFRRGMEPPELKGGWTRENERVERSAASNLEEALRNLFEQVLRQALTEIKRQNDSGEGGKPFNSWGIIKSENGQEFKLSLEGEPPAIGTIPSLN